MDSLILAAASTHWRKVARIIGQVSDQLGEITDEATHARVAERIEALVESGHLEAQGDLSQWRYSEVRLPNAGT